MCDVVATGTTATTQRVEAKRRTRKATMVARMSEDTLEFDGQRSKGGSEGMREGEKRKRGVDSAVVDVLKEKSARSIVRF
jgi:hypothetical protein